MCSSVCSNRFLLLGFYNYIWWTSKSKGLSKRFLNDDNRIIKQMKLCSCKTLRSWQAYAILLDICFITASENATSFRNALLRLLMQSTVLGIIFIYKTKFIKSCSTQLHSCWHFTGDCKTNLCICIRLLRNKTLKIGDFSKSDLENVLSLYKLEHLP